MNVYLVGGAVRDALLSRPVIERDWVVVGATPEQMAALGFRLVGKDFPVYLHPQTHEEYALARTERKSGPGYTGFDCYAGTDVSLTDDLKRRDLTVNAMAQDDSGTIFDPHGGQQDLEARVLRHVSSAFEEDPLRILRVARFAARYHHLGFTVAEATMALMQTMVERGDLEELVPERVWSEMDRALGETHPEIFFSVLAQCGGIHWLIPAFDNSAIYSDGIAKLCAAAAGSADVPVRLAALLLPLPAGEIQALGARLKIPNRYTELAHMANIHRGRVEALEEDSASQVLRLLEDLDAFRRSERFHELIQVCRLAVGSEKPNLTHDIDSNARLLEHCLSVAAAIGAGDVTTHIKGPALGEAIRALRQSAIEDSIREWGNDG